MTDIQKYYCILNLKNNASLEELKTAYRQEVRKWHPDRFIEDKEKQREALNKIKAINEAYEILKVYCGNHNSNKKVIARSDKYKIEKDRFYYNLALEKVEKGNYEESLDYFAKAIKLNPEYLEAFKARKKVLEKLGFQHRVKADIKKILDLELKQRASRSNNTNNGYNNSSWQCKMFLKEYLQKGTSIVNYQDKYLIIANGNKTIKVLLPLAIIKYLS